MGPMDAWQARGTPVALSAMGIVATLVGMALIEVGGRGASLVAGAAWIATAGNVTVVVGASLLFAAIFSYVAAGRARKRAPADDADAIDAWLADRSPDQRES